MTDANGSTVTVTKRGHAVAVIGPAKTKTWKSLNGILAGKVQVPDDLLDKDNSELWDCAQAGGAR
jgi:antitoxin (DNA-binding transcriptional repressor) of toxin-antitoxin stability system